MVPDPAAILFQLAAQSFCSQTRANGCAKAPESLWSSFLRFSAGYCMRGKLRRCQAECKGSIEQARPDPNSEVGQIVSRLSAWRCRLSHACDCECGLSRGLVTKCDSQPRITLQHIQATTHIFLSTNIYAFVRPRRVEFSGN